MAYKLFIKGKRNGYTPNQCGTTLTVGKLITLLKDFNEDMRIYLSNNYGYTYGSINETDIWKEDAEKQHNRLID